MEANSRLTFNHVLTVYGISPDRVQLARHKDNRGKGLTPYILWRSNRPAFELYQSVQGANARGKNGYLFDVGGLLASFVVDHGEATVLAGLYSIESCGPCPPDDICPLRGKPHGPGNHLYSLVRDNSLDDLVGRLVIKWGEGFRSWLQRANHRPKPIVELRKVVEEPPFPGFFHFRESSERISALPVSWQQILRVSRGVYLLVDDENGRQYVGSATGGDGFLGRFMDYEANGHGGNVFLIKAGRRRYIVSILETAGSNASRDDILRLEAMWTRKLGSRAFGLNGKNQESGAHQG